MWLVIALVTLAQRELEWLKYFSQVPLLVYEGSSRLLSLFYKSKNCHLFKSEAWNIIFQVDRISLYLLFLLKSQDNLHEYKDRGLNNLVFSLTTLCSNQLQQLEYSQNLIELLLFWVKNFLSSFRIDTKCIWNR